MKKDDVALQIKACWKLGELNLRNEDILYRNVRMGVLRNLNRLYVKAKDGAGVFTTDDIMLIDELHRVFVSKHESEPTS